MLSLYHALLSFYACQSPACDLTTGLKLEAASAHQMGPQCSPTDAHNFTLSSHVFVFVSLLDNQKFGCESFVCSDQSECCLPPRLSSVRRGETEFEAI